MQEPLRIAFHNLDPPPAVEEQVRKRVDELERFFDRIIACRVVVEVPHCHDRQDRLYHIGIVLDVPGREIVVRREPSERQIHEDLSVAIHDAFDAVRRQLQDYVRVMQDEARQEHSATCPP